MSDLRTRDAVKTAGGSPIAIAKEIATLDPYTLTGDWFTIPLITDSNRAVEGSDTTVELEDLEQLTLTSTDTVTLSLTLIQQDLATKRWLEFESKGKSYCMVKQEHSVPVKNASGTEQYQYAVYPYVTRQSGITRNAKSAETEVTFDVRKVGNLVTVASIPNAATSGFSTAIPDVGVPAAQAYELVGVTAP